MFFYLFHNLNHGLFHTKEKSDGATNVRTIMLGCICWILFHVWVNSQNMLGYFIKDYFWWFFLLDVFIMGIIYKLYYNRSIFKELKNYDSDIYIEKDHKYIQPTKLNNQNNSFNLDILKQNSEKQNQELNKHEQNLENLP